MLVESDRAEHISFSVLENKGAESIGDGYGSTYKNSRMFYLKMLFSHVTKHLLALLYSNTANISRILASYNVK